MWLKVSFTNAGLNTSGVYCKSTWSISHSRSACLLALAIAFFSLRRNHQKVVQDPFIHCHVVLNPWAMFPSKWVFRLARLHGNFVMCPQMPHQVILGRIACIPPINVVSKFGPILCPMHTFYGNQGRGNHILNQKIKKHKT